MGDLIINAKPKVHDDIISNKNDVIICSCLPGLGTRLMHNRQEYMVTRQEHTTSFTVKMSL